MRVTLDRMCDMGYVYLDEPVESDYSIEVKDKGETAFVMDINSEGHLVGIEVFNASKRLPSNLYKIAEDNNG